MSKDNIYVTRTALPPYEEYIEAIKPLWDSHWITNMGRYHEELEEKLRGYLEVEEVSLVVNGHMALELAIQAMEFPAGGEVITTPFTFISTTHAIVRNNLIPVFCDVKETDGTIDEEKIEALITEKTVAIVPVHVYGHICNVEKIEEIAEKYGLKVIYDAAHAFGEKYKGRGIANLGDCSIFSFHATKVFHTIEGGAIACNNKALYEKLYNLKNFGIRGEELVVEVGANAKLNEFSAIMGLCNMMHIDKEIAARKERYHLYEKELSLVEGIELYALDSSVDYNYGYFPVRVKEGQYSLSRDELYNKLKEHNICTRKYFYPLTSEQECYNGRYNRNITFIARRMSEQTLVLPLYSELNMDKIKEICELIRQG